MARQFTAQLLGSLSKDNKSQNLHGSGTILYAGVFEQGSSRANPEKQAVIKAPNTSVTSAVAYVALVLGCFIYVLGFFVMVKVTIEICRN